MNIGDAIPTVLDEASDIDNDIVDTFHDYGMEK